MADDTAWTVVRHNSGTHSAWPSDMGITSDYQITGFLGTRAEADAFLEGRCVRDRSDWRVDRSYQDGVLWFSLYLGPNLESEILIAGWTRPDREGWQQYRTGPRDYICDSIRRIDHRGEWIARVERLFAAFDKGLAA